MPLTDNGGRLEMNIGRCRALVEFKSKALQCKKGDELYILRKNSDWFMGIKLPVSTCDVLHAVIGTFPRSYVAEEPSSYRGNMYINVI